MAKGTTKTETNENEVKNATEETVTGAAQETAEQPKEKTYTATEVEALVKSVSEKAAKDAVEAYIKSQGEHPVVEVKKDEYVTLLYIDAVADSSVLTLGKLGQINRVGGTLDIPKKEFFQGIDRSEERRVGKECRL